ncbi:phosphoglycerate kinase [candidate division WOR-1 bacterium RIFOXYA12_FULL_43_27]|uniref:Phosphoglycerate kinase n=1 Tax=candidate division WOR-1 bacterium RIFOXYC2_FULL_46_14 TaxID=1802587 RepID=A0A1F4U3Y0_UNCSA|nr:MAG: phosphoglycerate kinase [candidate division WOR-1 bacterium RIFOXYA12_FULL_43_27]OGC20073.1 MAG: phosphoglycerate kinase [candidate division WOR-1 bacterium RIFOXYB2_FULL_46_45]OGC32191.1 MAG: phosphoglycerate kinase [candidate division WOR-1 bacterium RIFOXYA2_FULL_46_56]OGC39591.1 MAG: phosphoglycerate kinase [candidate division WOR-1 bacterium RIFOXYC2_FULL_46_14]
MAKKTVKDIPELSGKRVFVRCDFNVPLDEKQNITSDKRIKASLPTIKYLIDKGAKVILASHLGRPKGEVKKEFSLAPVQKKLAELLGKPVLMTSDCIGPEVQKAVSNMKNGDVILLENLRFHKEEEKNDPQFAKELASLADLFVSDAFGTVHRAHASTEGIAHDLPAYAGFLIEKELKFLGEALDDPKRPFVAIIGGAKISGKLQVLKNLLAKVDTLIVGGGMAYTFFKARGIDVGNSIVEPDLIPEAKEILKEAIDSEVPFLLPIDHVVADKFAEDADTQIVPRATIPEGWQGMDIGPDTISKFGNAIRDAKTIVWNGPMGVFEMDKFAAGTIEIAKIVAEATAKGAVSIIGGGDSASAIKKAGLTDKMSHISTGGGASLEFMEGKVLPGIACLQDKD